MAFYRPNFLSPESIAVNGSQDNSFSCQVNVSGETVTQYRLKILTMANASVYDTGTTSTSVSLYDKERLYHTVPSGTLTNGNQYKWTITTNPVAATPVYSREIPFWSYSTPTVVFSATPSTITAKSYNFICAYSQAQSVPFTKWRMVWYDVSNNIIEDSGWQFSGFISYTFDGFIDESTYKVKCFVENQVGTLIDTGFYQFNVDYAAPNLEIVPDVIFMPDIGAVEVRWGRAIQITGVVDSGTPTYTDDFMVVGNKAVNLDSSTKIHFDNLGIPQAFTAKFVWQPQTDFDGPIAYLDDSKYEFGYDSSLGVFYLSGTLFPSTLYSAVVTLVEEPYLIALQNKRAYIIKNNTLIASVTI